MYSIRFTALLLIGILGIGCNRNANSQQQVETPAVLPAPSLGEVTDQLYESRTNAITRVVETASPAVVSVNVMAVQRVEYRDPFSDPWMEFFYGRSRSRVYEQQVQSVGSGFVISADGYIVTNEHVAHNAAKITVAFMDGATLDATLIGSDEASDLALIKVAPPEPLPHLSFAENGSAIPGEWAIALGNPFGLFEAAEPTVTVGVVSGTGRDFQPQENRIYRDMIQTDAAINQGNSGGPLINALGEVIGVNTFIYTSGNGGSIGLGFAVPADKAMRIVQELKETGQVDRSYYTGLRGWDVNERIARALGLTEQRGFVVRDVDPGSPADLAGFKPYDVILTFEDEPIDGQVDLAARLTDFRPGDAVHLGVFREGKMYKVEMQLGRQDTGGR
ncbi:MAG: trypsin-like peptidase domain-containing protein [Rhodothermales bacterium]|nr:trypsin-like peptidase domain-containing protein [Rhodothermales bacterium]